MIEKTAEDIINEKEEGPIVAGPDTTVFEAVSLILEKGANAVLIEKDGKYVGIWTERDLLRNVLIDDFDPKHSRVGDFMSSPLISVPYNYTIYQLIDTFLGKGIRHLLIEKNGEYIGLLYARDIIRAGLTERTLELKELNEMVDWEYYEDWKWGKKNK